MSTTTVYGHFSTPKKHSPNPHPYAIKTTSTAVLSRNNSSSSTPLSTHHYIPPSSPSPSPTKTGGFEGGERRYTRHRHRYSRSLNSELPRPLPTPPPPTGVVGTFSDHDDTPRRKVQHAYSLPELPEDPKRWTSTEVSMYLTSSLNMAGGGHDLVHDISAFVKDKKITGKSFLGLNEVNLEQYGINRLWRTTLVDASRALRRNVLRGRIWDNLDDDEDDDNDLSSNSNLDTINRKRSLSTTSESRGRVRDMVETLERSSSGSELEEEFSRRKDSKRNKVHHHDRHQEPQQRLPQRGSVNNLFGTSGHAPDTAEDKDSTITRRNANEPRLLPFPPTDPTGYAHVLTPLHTGTAHPLPPSPDHARTTPHYLGSNTHQPYLFPSQPHQHPNTFDYYELGFKNSLPLSPPPTGLGSPIRSPNSQRYVVQHNNVQSSATSRSNSGATSNGSKGRLLPYPPIVGEAELFHPRPRMGMGVGGLAGGLEDRLNESGDRSDEGRASERGGDESAYHSALESQTESADSDSGVIDTKEGSAEGSGITSENEVEIGHGNEVTGEEKQDEAKYPENGKAKEEEPSVQVLLLAQPHPISGVEAWEMELGETVKRINNSTAVVGDGGGSIMSDDGSKTRTRPQKRELIMGEIGRKNGRMSGRGEEVGKKTIGGVLDPELFEAPDQDGTGGDDSSVDDTGSTKASISLPDSSISAPISALDERESSIAERESTIIQLESSLDLRESSISERESSITARESSIAERESVIIGRESIVAERELSLDIRESSIVERESTISQQESAITARESAITAEIQQRMMDVQQRELEVDKWESSVQKREQEVSEREIKVERREEEVNEWYRGKLVEIEKATLIHAPPTPTAAKSRWPPSPIEFARRLCATFLLPVLGEERTPGFLLPGIGAASFTTSSITPATSSSTTSTTPPTATTTTPPPPISSLSLQRDPFIKRILAVAGGGSYFVLVSIGICVVFLRGVVRRIWRVGGSSGGLGRR